MSDQLTPAVRAPKFTKEHDSRSVPPTQKPDITLPPLHEAVTRDPEILVVDPSVVAKKEYYEQLAFNEEPVTILIHRSGEKNAGRTTDLVAVNGTKAEVLFEKNGWVQIGWLPRGVQLTTKRKYVEQLAHAKVDDIATKTGKVGDENPENIIERTTRTVNAFSVVHDSNPRGAEWLDRLLRAN